jgi:FRG domain
MGTIYRADNVEDAVRMAQQFRAEGKYDWFRGQAREWPPVSTFSRLDQDRKQEAREKAEEFYQWVAEEPDLAYLARDEQLDALCAIAQHYGIPTNYVDFTTDPAIAGFFACDTGLPADGSLSCLYCLKIKEFNEFCEKWLEDRRKNGAVLRLLEVDVSNLWRLQAQHGKFLFSNYNWEIDYDLDKITFPHRGYPSFPLKDYVYPLNKSPLELKLDQFFALTKLREGNQRFKNMIDEVNRSGGDIAVSYVEAEPDGYRADAFVDPANLRANDSWSESRILAWSVYREEHFRELDSRVEKILLSKSDASEVERQVGYAVGQILAARPFLRDALVNWRIDGGIDARLAETLVRRLQRAWDGMRVLPYLDDQIAVSLAKIAGLAVLGWENQSSSMDYHDHFRLFYGEGTRVEIANFDGTYTRSYVSKVRFSSMLIPSSIDYLNDDFQKYLDHPSAILQIVQDPKILYDFEMMIELFSQEVIPAQIHMQRDVLAFNPVSILRFGLP